MTAAERLLADLDAAMDGGGTGLHAADELCRACVEFLGVDGAAVSYVRDGSSSGTFGSSGELSRGLDELQFTFGEGPCYDAVATKATVFAPDLALPSERRWPAFSRAVLSHDVRAVFAVPVIIAASPVGALDVFRHDPGGLSSDVLEGLVHAAHLAAFPLLDIMTIGRDWAAAGDGDQTGPGADLHSLERVEVYQATGMVMDQLGVGADEALLRLRAHAFATNQTASAVAWALIARTLTFRDDQTGAN